MTRQSLLFYATGVCFAFTVLVAVSSLFDAMRPTKDLTSRSQSSVRSISVENFAQGEAKFFKFGKVPVVVWRRDYAQQIKALEHIGLHVGEDLKLLDEVKANGAIEIESGKVLRLEWFVVSPINVGGYGCIVLRNAGDFGGFFDSCQSVHFDLWGQAKAGPTKANLKPIPWTLSDDGTTIYVDLTSAPKVD